jgi:hypothetical protein
LLWVFFFFNFLISLTHILSLPHSSSPFSSICFWLCALHCKQSGEHRHVQVRKGSWISHTYVKVD